MRNISIGFSKPTHKFFPIFSWAIRFFDGTEFSHVYVRQSTHYNIDLIYQASGMQVNFINGNLFLEKEKVIKEFPFQITDEAYDKYMKFALTNVGKPYGVLQVFGILACLIFKLNKNPFPNGNADFVCSELVADILYEVGKFKYDRELFDRIKPKEIWDFCQTGGLQ